MYVVTSLRIGVSCVKTIANPMINFKRSICADQENRNRDFPSAIQNTKYEIPTYFYVLHTTSKATKNRFSPEV